MSIILLVWSADPDRTRRSVARAEGGRSYRRNATAPPPILNTLVVEGAEIAFAGLQPSDCFRMARILG